LAVSYCNLSPKEFYSLTPHQFDLILSSKAKFKTDEFDFFESQFRLMNYYTVKTCMGDTSHINSPQKLYPLRLDENVQPQESKPFVLNDEDLKQIKKLISP
jgi:hypothetical protein